MEHFTAYDLQRHIGRVQSAAEEAPVAITHHGTERFVLMEYARWQKLGRGDLLADSIKRLQACRGRIRQEGIAAISIFGSIARGDAHDGSDIDLLVEPIDSKPVGGLQLVRWKSVLSEILGRGADVVVREFLDKKVEAGLARDRVEALITREEDSGYAA